MKYNHVKIISILLLSMTGNVYGGLISSNFDTNAEGWVVSGDSTSGVPTYIASGGNSGGHIEADDTVSGGVWYFDAPDKFLGNMAGTYNQALQYDLKQTGTGDQFNARDVILNGAGIELKYFGNSNPLPLGSWVSYSVILGESAGWQNGNVAASVTDILTVLGSLDRLRIRGEFITGPDTGRLDTVSINTVPIPGAAWLFGSALAGFFGIAKRRSKV